MGRSKRLPWNWRKRIEIRFKEDDCNYTFFIQFKNKQEIEGFEKKIGVLTVDKEEPYIVSVADIDEDFRRKGLGKQLYIKAIKKLGKLSTNYHEASSLAKYVWKSLANEYEHEFDFWEGILTVRNKKLKRGQKA